MSKSFITVSTLVGTIIGAGILGIPYVVMKAGFFIGIINMVVVAAIMITLMLYLGEISLRTRTNHQLTGYASLYLGKKGKLAMFISFAFGIYAALLAYLIAEGESLSFLFFNSAIYSLHAGIIFWLALSVITYLGLKALEKGEGLGLIIILVLIISLSVFFLNKIEISNLTYNNPSEIFTPFGIVLFSFLGLTSIPQIERILVTKDEKRLTKRLILISNLFVLAVYTIFTAIVLGSQGQSTPSIATLTLGKPFILFGIVTMFTSYLALALALIDTLQFDYKISRKKSWFYTTIVPIFLFLILSFFKSANFTKVLGIGGVISGGLMAILILAMVKNSRLKGDRKPEYSMPISKLLNVIIITLLIIGTIIEIWNAV